MSIHCPNCHRRFMGMDGCTCSYEEIIRATPQEAKDCPKCHSSMTVITIGWYKCDKCEITVLTHL